jgi:hypothetical protein
MRLKSLLLAAAVAGLAGLAGWALANQAIPVVATDTLFARFQKAGAKVNRLSPPPVRNARRNLVPMDNADTLTRSVIIDLKDGPLLFEADVPAGAEYWSVSLFAHNTDTFFVASDRTTGPGPYRLIIRARDQAQPGVPADATAVSPSRKAFLIIRAVMPDRNDAIGVEALRQTLLRERIGPASSKAP